MVLFGATAHHLDLLCLLDEPGKARDGFRVLEPFGHTHAERPADALQRLQAGNVLSGFNTAEHGAGDFRATGEVAQRKGLSPNKRFGIKESGLG